jgi:hypothetical protein
MANLLDDFDLVKTGRVVDYLYKWNEVKQQIKMLIKAKDYQQAWSLTFKLDEIAIKHAKSSGGTIDSWLTFINSSSEYRAVILSKEGKHVDALFNGAFRAIVERRPIAKYEKKMMVYFRKANLNCTESEFLTLFNSAKKSKDLALFEKKFRLLTKK